MDIYGLFKAIDFPIDYYKKVEKSNLPRLIGACQDYLRNIIEGIPVKKIPRNLYVKHTHNLWSCKEFKDDVRIVFNEDEQEKRMRFILIDHSVFVERLPLLHRDAWLAHVPGLIDFCHKIKESKDFQTFPDYEKLKIALIEYEFNFESYKSFAEKEFDLVEHIQDFVYCLHTGIEESKVFNFLPHLPKEEVSDDFIVKYNCPFEYKRVDNTVIPYNPPNDDESSVSEENQVSSKPEEVSNNENFEVASLHRKTLKENYPTLYNKYKNLPEFLSLQDKIFSYDREKEFIFPMTMFESKHIKGPSDVLKIIGNMYKDLQTLKGFDYGFYAPLVYGNVFKPEEKFCF